MRTEPLIRTEPLVPTADQARLLMHRAGGSPVYAYSRAVLGDCVRRVRAASVPGCALYYSLKANPHPGVVTALVPLVDGFDVCSLGELETALNAGAAPCSVLFTGPAKSGTETAAALAARVAVTVESPGQARLLARTARDLGVAGRAVVRLNVPYPGRGPHAPAAANQFGVADQDLAEVVAALSGSPVRVAGLQLFWGSQYADAKTVLAARGAALARAGEVSRRHGLEPEFVSVGGGIALPWLSGDPEVDWQGLTAAAAAAPAPAGGPAVVCEYGRSIAGPAGVLLTTVLDTKTVDGRHYVLVDAGLHHAMLTSRLVAGGDRGEPGVLAVGAPEGAATRPTTVTGPLCSQLDVLAENVPLPVLRTGDILMVLGTGAYGPTFSPSGFLSRDKVREIVF